MNNEGLGKTASKDDFSNEKGLGRGRVILLMEEKEDRK